VAREKSRRIEQEETSGVGVTTGRCALPRKQVMDNSATPAGGNAGATG